MTMATHPCFSPPTWSISWSWPLTVSWIPRWMPFSGTSLPATFYSIRRKWERWSAPRGRRLTQPQYFQFYQKLLAIVEERQDYLQAMADRARAVGLEFFPSLRMNDCHDSPVWRAVDTFSQYRKDHSELLLGDSVHPGFSTGFDFAFPEVRERQAQDRRRAHVHLEVLDGVSAPGATSSDGNQPPSDPPCYPESPPQWTRDGRGGPAPTRLWHRSLIGIALLASCGATCEKQVREPDSSQSFRGNQP